ncbi:6513_t:CDS:2 [Ambispora gerdemannii]|uniref:6513_t:CDS:1 n=1 Tax=Ambispora gerdemannii TaxID=144530 RepID=A0A9N9G368_9GLOM|nr:6513_t:CDS:2 [Ambispora gerdemannii]
MTKDNNKPETSLVLSQQKLATNGTANSQPPANLKPCCACPDTKRVRDECIFAKEAPVVTSRNDLYQVMIDFYKQFI